METREALLRAINDKPEEDTPRLVFADLLDEEGYEASTARGKFIRLQCELARLTADDPQVTDLRKREAEMLRLHAAQWLSHLPKTVQFEFQRGFVNTVQMARSQFRNNAKRIFGTEPIQELEIRNPYPHPLEEEAVQHREEARQSIARILASPHLLQLKRLMISGYDTDTYVQDVSAHIRRWSRLEILQLVEGYAHAVELIPILQRGSETLRELDLSQQMIGDDDSNSRHDPQRVDRAFQMLAEGRRFPQLRRLVLHENDFLKNSDAAFLLRHKRKKLRIEASGSRLSSPSLIASLQREE